MIVLGSNLGWQCLFASLTFGFSADGYELVPYRFHAARQFAEKHQVSSNLQPQDFLLIQAVSQIDGVTFHNADITKASINWSNATVVYLTDLSWDQTVRE